MSTSLKSDFRLVKWYLDCVTDSGETFIGYVATLEWKRFKVPYSSTIFLSSISESSVVTRMSKPSMPLLNGMQIFWKDYRLKIDGNWQQNHNSIEARLHESPNGYLHWNCYQPNSIVKLNFRNQKLNGYGYVEMLELTDSPWHIDMATLRWGRYSSNTDNLVWIQIKGNKTRQWVWLNGNFIINAEVNDKQIVIPEKDIVLELDQSGVIESEQKIFNTVKMIMKYLPGFEKIIPVKFLYSDETKWRSYGTLKQKDIVRSKGWAIHELVDFN